MWIALAALPDLGVRQGGAVADGHHVAGADEHVRLAELDLAVLHLRRAQDDEERLAVLLELRALVGVARVLDRQLVQAELVPDLVEGGVLGLVQPDPHELSRDLQDLADVVEGDVAALAALAVRSAVDDGHGCADIAEVATVSYRSSTRTRRRRS
jgi:hypothetical protein